MGDRPERSRRWVVGVDGSEGATGALDWALQHADERASELRLVMAWHVPLYGPSPMDGPLAQPYDDRGLLEAARAGVDDRVAEATARTDLPVEGLALEGGAATTLLAEAEDAALLVLGNRGLGGFSRLLLGSTSAQCATHATVPTVVVRGEVPHRPARQVLVGVDGSPNSLAALEWALHFAAPGSTVRALWVWDSSPLAVGADEFFFPEASDIAIERFHHLVDDRADIAHGRSVELERSFIHGRPRHVLADESREVDLVVCGARGMGAIGAALLGSVTTWLLHHIELPLVVVPEEQSRTAGSDGHREDR